MQRYSRQPGGLFHSKIIYHSRICVDTSTTSINPTSTIVNYLSIASLRSLPRFAISLILLSKLPPPSLKCVSWSPHSFPLGCVFQWRALFGCGRCGLAQRCRCITGGEACDSAIVELGCSEHGAKLQGMKDPGPTVYQSFEERHDRVWQGTSAIHGREM
jgi:hypothetical protein